MKHEAVTNTQALADAAQQSLDIVYLMGASFVIGSLFTILILILLDFMKRDRVPNEPD
jgi:hypothetical protein